MPDATQTNQNDRRRSTVGCFCELVHLTALALWLAGIAASGVVAAVAFPTLRTLNVRLPEYAAAGEQHYLIAAGSVARRVFLLADALSFGSSIVAVLTLLAMVTLLGTPRSRPATWVRSLALGVALAALASMLLIVTPRLDAATAAHWAAMRAGEVAAMATHKASVDDIHPIASNLVSLMGLGVLVAFVAGIWAAIRPWSSGAAGDTHEVPLLARRRWR